LKSAARRAKVAAVKPFRRGRFEELPDKPRRPHNYFQSRAVEIRVESSGFGPLNVHCRELGAGPPLLLVHGLMTTSYSWRYVLDDLARDFRVIAPDLPGCGRSSKPAARYSGEALARFIVELQGALDIRGCAVVGNSMGGYLCMRAALADPGAFSRVVNVHSPGPSNARMVALHALLSLPPLRALLSWWVRRAPRRWAHRNVHYYDESLKSLEEASEYGDPLDTVEGADAFVRYLWHAFDPAELRAFMRALGQREFPVPLLLIYARRDPLVPPSIGRVLHQHVPRSSLVWLEESSHFAHVDTPERVLAAMRGFLASRGL
jgi:pimeloyl-ACP methyl ester carboxylesterase